MRRSIQAAAVAVLAALTLSACDEPASDNSAEAPQAPRVPDRPKVPIMIRIIAGEPKQSAFLVQPTQDVPLDQLAAGVRETGYHCNEVSGFEQLEQNGNRMDVYKIDCGARSYQVTMIDGHSHIKPWSGNIFGR